MCRLRAMISALITSSVGAGMLGYHNGHAEALAAETGSTSTKHRRQPRPLTRSGSGRRGCRPYVDGVNWLSVTCGQPLGRIVMARRLWGCYSVADHLVERAFVADLLVYDRLVVPVPSDDDRERWEKAWNPTRQGNC